MTGWRGIFMDRTEPMREYLKPYLAKRLHRKISEMEKVQKNMFRQTVGDLFQKALLYQRKDSAWKPSCMGLFHLLYGLLNDTPAYQIILADGQFYFDGRQQTEFWYPDFLYRRAEEEEELYKYLRGGFLRVNSYELSYLCHWVFFEYRKLIGVYWKNQVTDITLMEEFQMLNKSFPFDFLFGDYMGEILLTFRCGERG